VPAPGAPAAAAASALPSAPVETAAATASAALQAATATDALTQGAAGGGERPAFTPRVNPYGYAEGDTFTYRVIDGWKNEVSGSTTTAIEEVLDDGQLLANGQTTELDAQGRLKSQRQPDGSVSQFEPCQDLWWSNPTRGESRRVDFKENVQRPDGTRGQIEWKGSSRVGRPAKIETPAGEFEVLPIETKGWYYEAIAGRRISGQFSRTVWYSNQLGHPVAIDIEDTDSLGKLLKRERVELTHAQQSRAAP
jgi:YD repeat-containing protein